MFLLLFLLVGHGYVKYSILWVPFHIMSLLYQSSCLFKLSCFLCVVVVCFPWDLILPVQLNAPKVANPVRVLLIMVRVLNLKVISDAEYLLLCSYWAALPDLLATGG